jgi:arylsulfatase A-like enzyme
MRSPGRALPLLALGFAAAPALAAGARAADPRPDIVLIVLDTVRADAVGRVPGSPRTNTPFLDGWSRHGLVFSRALSPADNTPGSHFSILTGYPARAYTSSVDTPQASVVAQLGAAGYDTLGLSANPAVDPALMRSIEPFQTFAPSPYVTATPLSQEGWDTLQRHGVPPAPGARGVEPNLAKVLASARAVNERLAELVAGCRPSGGFVRPVFLFLNFLDAHDPYFPPRSAGPPDSTLAAHWPRTGDLRRDRPETRAEPAVSGEVPTPENVPRWRRAGDLGARDLAFLRSLYDAEVRALDARLEATMRILGEAGLLRRAVVVVTSDHGEAFGEQGFLGHALEQHGVHVPALYRVPLLVRGYGVDLRPAKPLAGAFSTVALADSIRAWAGLAGGLGPALDPVAVVAPSGRRRAVAAPLSAASAPGDAAPAPAARNADQKARDEELARRLRSLGYLK